MGLQVDFLTKGKELWEKDFIDFEFDGKLVSEFGLVAANGGDRYSIQGSPDFEDEVTEVKGAIGATLLGAHRYKPQNELLC